MTRTLAIQLYLSAVALGAVVYVGLAPDLRVSNSLLIAGLLLAPAIVAYRIWPEATSETAMDVMRRR